MDIITLNINMERFRRQRRRQRQGEKNETCKIITAVERELAHTPDYHNYRFYRVNRCYSEEKKSIFRKASRQILKKGERLLKKILRKDPTNTDIFSEVNKLDMQVRWSLSKAAIMAFGRAKDLSCITLNERGNTKKPEGPAKAIDLHAMEEGELNELFIPATGGRKRV